MDGQKKNSWPNSKNSSAVSWQLADFKMMMSHADFCERLKDLKEIFPEHDNDFLRVALIKNDFNIVDATNCILGASSASTSASNCNR